MFYNYFNRNIIYMYMSCIVGYLAILLFINTRFDISNRYYITNIKDELRYYQPNILENNIIELVQESLSESYEDDEAIILSNLNDPEILSDNTDKENLNIQY